MARFATLHLESIPRAKRMIVEIPRGSGPGRYRPVRGWASARLTCPKCGFDAELDHNIANDGRVTPSVLCPQGCGFHEHVRLLGWKQGPR